ncbi:MAG: TonB-dependent receptor [Bacteroidales bacterium]|nr:TonB-dependent receptor [Bacteroidales bacterium]
MKNLLWQKGIVIFISALFIINTVKGQSGEVFGNLLSTKTEEPVLYAAVILYHQNDSSLYLSTITNDKGVFTINNVKEGLYYLKTSCLGFNEIELRDIPVNSSRPKYNCGTIELDEKSFQLEEIKVIAKRARGTTSNEKTTYVVKTEMNNSSHSGTELLKYIPGVQMDLKKNIYLEGNSNVIILINGIERDKSYLDQLNPEKIDRIDVSRGTSSKYEAEAAGVINIILKKDIDQGFAGNINLENPVTNSAVFVNPSASLSYGKNKLSMLLNYTGSFHYFDIDGNKDYDIFSDPNDLEIYNNSTLEQKNWNHRINLSVDYFMNDKNSFTFYTYYNPFKNEFGGNSSTEILSSDINPSQINYSSKELDRNAANLYSLFYNHKFNKPLTELTIDVSHYSYHSNSKFSVWDINQTGNYAGLPSADSAYSTKSKPERCSNYIKLDYTSQLNNKLKIDLGSKYMIDHFSNRNSDDFEYSKKDLSAYAMIRHNYKKLTTTIGLRGEYTISELKNEFNKDYLSILPYFVTSYKLADKHTLKLSYNKSILRPGLYDLNPYVSAIDLYSAQQGNSSLDLGYINKYALEYSTQIKSSYLAFQLFYRCIENKIHHIGEYTNDNLILFTPVNIERETEYGLQMSGSISLFKFLYLIPYFKLYEYDLKENDLFYQSNKSGISHETSLSAIIMLKHGFSVSLMYQNYSAKYSIQNRTYNDVQYFFSIDKKFGNNLKVGISAAVPFTNSLSYFENDFRSPDFNLNQKENITFSSFPLWFKLSYSFNSGKKIKRNKVQNDIQEVKNKKGF